MKLLRTQDYFKFFSFKFLLKSIDYRRIEKKY